MKHELVEWERTHKFWKMDWPGWKPVEEDTTLCCQPVKNEMFQPPHQCKRKKPKDSKFCWQHV